jgi:hypothetical protein
MTELERIDQAAEYFRRYYQKEAAITQNRENQEYLKTYIHDEDYVVKNFDIAPKIMKSIGISVAAGVAVFVLLWLLFRNVIVAAVLGGFTLVGLAVFTISLQHYRLTAAKQNQVEVNEGITEQIQILKSREPQLIEQKESYYKGLEKRIDFMSLEDMKYIDEMRKLVESGEAKTAEDASALIEQKMLMAQFNNIMEQSDVKTYTDAENKERFGDPLELIKKKRKPFFKKKQK